MEIALGLTALRGALESTGYTEQQVLTALGTDYVVHSPAAKTVYRYKLHTDQPLHSLIKLFLLGIAVQETELERVFNRPALEALCASEILENRSGFFFSKVRITPLGNHVFAHDRGDGDLHEDHVVGIGPAPRTLAGLTIRRPVESVLDIGTGCGVQAILAAQHAEEVVATDISPRAIWYAKMNAFLNRTENVVCLEGDLFGPVTGRRFDLIVANPPFVISPAKHFIYRDSGMRGDGMSESVVRQLPSFLKEGGFANVLLSWVCEEGAGDSDRPLSWLAGLGCDALLLHHDTEDPLTYAATWNHELEVDSDAFEAETARWLDYLGSLGARGIATGALVLRRRDRENWIRMEEMPRGPLGSASEHILRMLDAQDYLGRTTGANGLLGDVFSLVDEHRLEQTLTYRHKQYQVEGTQLILSNGVGLAGQISPNTLQVLFLLDGVRTLGSVIDEVEAAMETQGQFREEIVSNIRRLLELGFLIRH